MEPGDYEKRLAEQGGSCAICHQNRSHPLADQLLDVDHCHTTGKVRGILCRSCNIGLGHFMTDPALLRAAADYLERNP
jgi:nitrate/TMAO reductase-like tetraheme cytochrome c subunit